MLRKSAAVLRMLGAGIAAILDFLARSLGGFWKFLSNRLTLYALAILFVIGMFGVGITSEIIAEKTAQIFGLSDNVDVYLSLAFFLVFFIGGVYGVYFYGRYRDRKSRFHDD